MIHRSFAVACVFLAALSFVGCEVQPMETSPPSADKRTGIQFKLSGGGDIASLDITMKRVSCNGEPIVPFTHVERADVAHETPPTSNIFIGLDPGCYDVTITPLTADGNASTECNSSVIDKLVIAAGQTTEIGASSQCIGALRGAVDVYAPIKADVTAAQFILTRTTCSGESFDPETFDETNTISGPEQTILEGFFLVPPGCYDLQVQPLRSVGTPSEQCATSQHTNVVVVDGVTTEVSTEFVCQ